MRVKATDIAITPDFNNSELTLGPTFSTLLKLKLFPNDLIELIISIYSSKKDIIIHLIYLPSLNHWTIELNTILELIRFQIPLQRTNANLHRLSQQIIAREMLFKRRIRLVSELRTQNRLNISQMIIIKQEPIINKLNNDNNDTNDNNDNNKKSFFSFAKNQSIEALP